jgi:hypothetical protein
MIVFASHSRLTPFTPLCYGASIQEIFMFDEDGFDANGYNAEGVDRKGFDRTGRDTKGDFEEAQS